MNFASPDTAPGTTIRFNISQTDTEVWQDCTVVGPDPKNTAHLLVKDKYGKEWSAHWGNTRLS